MTDDFARDAEARERQLETLERLSQRFGTSLSDAFSRTTTEGRRLDGVLQSLARSLLTATLRSALQPLQSSLHDGVGALFSGGGEGVTPFAKGGVIAAPTYFPLGLAGERGAEAVMPLARGPDGRLGVQAGGTRPVAVTVNIQASDVESFRRSESEVAASLARTVSRGQRGL